MVGRVLLLLLLLLLHHPWWWVWCYRWAIHVWIVLRRESVGIQCRMIWIGCMRCGSSFIFDIWCECRHEQTARIEAWTKKNVMSRRWWNKTRILYQVHHFLAFAERVGDVCWQDPFLDRDGNVWSCLRTSACLCTWKSFLQIVELVIDPIRSRIMRLWSRLSILIRTKEKRMYRGSIRTE